MSEKISKKFGAGLMAILVLVCFIPAVAGAFSPGDARHDNGPHWKALHRSVLGIWRDPQMIQKLALTKAQVKQLRDTDFAHRENFLSLKAQLDGFHLKMDKAFSADIVDHKIVRQIAGKISGIKGKLFIQDIESRLTLGKILNADQVNKLKLHAMDRKKQEAETFRKSISRHPLLDRNDY